MKYRLVSSLFVLLFIFASPQAAFSASSTTDYSKAQEEENGNVGLTPPGMPHEYVSKEKEMKDKDPAGSGFSVSCDQEIIEQKTGLTPISVGGVCEAAKQALQYGVTTGADGKARSMIMKFKKDFTGGSSEGGSGGLSENPSAASSSTTSSGSSTSGGGSGSTGMTGAGFKVDQETGPKSWGEQYKHVKENADNLILKWKDYPGLIPKVAGEPAAGTTAEEPEPTTAYHSKGEKKGEAVAYFSTKFKSNEEVAEAGACQMVMMPKDPKFYVKRMYPPKRLFENPETGDKVVLEPDKEEPEGFVFRYYKHYELSKSPAEGFMPVQFERVVNPSNPFAPRHDDYEDRISSGICHSGQDITKICLTDTKDEIGGMRAWEPAGDEYSEVQSASNESDSGNDSSSSQQVSFINSETGESQGLPASTSFMYYKKLVEDIGKSKNGADSQLDLMTTTPEKLAFFDATHDACYQACVTATFGAGEEVCCDICEYATCQMFILPPVKMDNPLKFAYTNSDGVEPIEPGLPSVTTDNRRSWDAGPADLDLPPEWGSGYGSNGMGFYESIPIDPTFRYRGPFIKHHPTGEPATMEFVKYKKTVVPGEDYEEEESEIDKEKWEPWRVVAVGVHPYVLPDESNITEKGVFNMGAQAGGFDQFKQYIANCIRDHGLNCACDVSSFENANQTGFVEGSDSTLPLDLSNESKVTSVPVEYTDPKTGEVFKSLKAVRSTKDSVMVGNPKRVLVGNYLYPAMPGVKGKMTPDGAETDEYPGPSSCQSSPEEGLDFARVGDIIRLKSDAVSEAVDKRKVIVAKVEAVEPPAETDEEGKWIANTDSENKCILISQGGAGAVGDSFGNTENSGRKTQRWLCKNKETSSGFNLGGILGGALFGGGGADELPSCATPYYQRCYEENWADYVVTRTKTDEQPDGSYACKDTTPRINYENLLEAI